MSFLKDYTAALFPRAVLGFALSAKSYFRARTMLPNYLDLIQRHFPGLLFRDAKLIDTGFGNVIVMLDDNWVFRFPRNEWRHGAFSRELWLLDWLEQQTAIKLPDYSYIAPGNYFGGYRKIQGAELSPRMFDSLDRSIQEKAVVQLADFLSILHGPTSQGDKEGPTFPQNQLNWQCSSYYFQEQRKYLSYKLDHALIESLDLFFELYAQPMLSPTCLVHGDLTADHLFFDREKEAVGVIDFGNAAMSDPAQDFAIFCSYPDWVAPFALEHYYFQAEDPDLPARARLHAVRFAFDHLWACLHYDGQTRDFPGTVKTLERQLALLGA